MLNNSTGSSTSRWPRTIVGLMGNAEFLAGWCLIPGVKVPLVWGGPTPSPLKSQREVSGWPHPRPSEIGRFAHGTKLGLFFCTCPQANTGENESGLTGLASLKIRKTGFLCLHGNDFQVLYLPPNLSVCRAGLQKEFRSNVFVEEMLIYKAASLTAVLMKQITIPKGDLTSSVT